MTMQQEKAISFSQDLKDSKHNIDKLKALAPTFLGLLCALGFYFLAPHYTESESTEREILNILKKNYVDNLEIIERKDSQSINDWLQRLDPHTYYLSPKKSKSLGNQLKGKLEGIGIYVQYSLDSALIFYVSPKSPAALAGLLPGDFITSVNGIETKEIMQSDTSLPEMIKGAENTRAQLQIYRPQSKASFNKEILRKSINISSTSDIFLMNNGIGYARLELFSNNSHQELRDSILSLKARGMEKLILDLRDNSGGLLGQAIKIANEFLEKGDLITYTEGAKRDKQNFEANGKGNFIGTPLTILVNSSSASASEVLAAALQENKKAQIIGEQTYGKGLVQESYYLSNGGSLNITIARYYTPNGKCIQKPYGIEKNSDSSRYGIMPNINILSTGINFPSFTIFRYMSTQYLYKKNWIASYPKASNFANQVLLKSDSFTHNLALGIMIYGPRETPNLLLTNDPIVKTAVNAF